MAFVGVTVLPMTGDAIVAAGQTVYVSGGSIVAVGPEDEVVIPGGALQVDSRGRYLMPGLADMHVHLEYDDDPGVLDLFLANGITTVRNMDGRPYILEWRDAIDGGDGLGPTIHTAGPILDGDPPLREDNLALGSPGDAIATVRAQAAAGYDFLKVYTNLSPATYAAILEVAAADGLQVSGHLPRGLAIEDALDSGIHSIEHLRELGDLVEADDSEFRDRFHWSKLYLGMPVDGSRFEDAAVRVAESGIWIVPTMVQADRALAPPDTIDGWLDAPEMAYIGNRGRRFWKSLVARQQERMDSGDWGVVEAGRRNRLRLLTALDRAGARLLLGTDTPNPFVVPGFSLHDEMASFESAGIERSRILELVTRGAADFLDAEAEFGTVEVGKRADLILLDSNPLVSLDALRKPVGVMVRGVWLDSAALAGMLAAIETRGGL